MSSIINKEILLFNISHFVAYSGWIRVENTMFHKDLVREYKYNKSFLIELILKWACVFRINVFRISVSFYDSDIVYFFLWLLVKSWFRWMLVCKKYLVLRVDFFQKILFWEILISRILFVKILASNIYILELNTLIPYTTIICIYRIIFTVNIKIR